MGYYNKKIGLYGESLAKSFLENKGYIILNSNFTSKHKEIDIIASLPNESYICFIEVKSRFSSKFGSPSESVTYKKINNLRKAADFYILKNNLTNENFRFDVVEVIFNNDLNDFYIEHIQNAF